MARVQVELDEGLAARLDAARGKTSRAAFVAAIVERGLLEGWTAVELLGGREAMLILAAMQSGATPEQIAEFKRSGFPNEVEERLGDAAERRELADLLGALRESMDA